MNKPTSSRQDLLALLCSITDPQVMDTVLETILSSRELDDLENRLQIFQLLLAKTPQREIAAQLKVGIATVSRGAATLKEPEFSQLATLLAKMQKSTTETGPGR